jgi:hypothetical protein
VPLADVGRVMLASTGGRTGLPLLLMLGLPIGALCLLTLNPADQAAMFLFGGGLGILGVGGFGYDVWKALRGGIWARGTILHEYLPPMDENLRLLTQGTEIATQRMFDAPVAVVPMNRARLMWYIRVQLPTGRQVDRLLPQWGLAPDAVRPGDEVDVLLEPDQLQVWEVLDHWPGPPRPRD